LPDLQYCAVNLKSGTKFSLLIAQLPNMSEKFTSDPASCASTPFETIFRWDSHWTSIHVRPVTEQPDFIHYKVTLIDGSFVYLWKDPVAGWEEGMGDTERARALGHAIEISAVTAPR
jgi:hypothetical protein